MNRHIRAVLIVSIAFGASVAACGDDDDALTPTEFRDQANAICAQGTNDIGAAVGSVFGNDTPTPEQLQEALDSIVSITRQQFDDVEALAVPQDLADDVDAMLAEGRSATDAAEAQGLGFFESEDDPWTRTAEMATALGLDACSGG